MGRASPKKLPRFDGESASHIIQFANLAAFIPELPVGHTVRVTALDVTEGTYEKISELRIAGIGAHVRAVNEDGHILTCYLPVAQLQVFGRRPRKGDPDEGSYSQAWDKATALKLVFVHFYLIRASMYEAA